MVSSMLRPRDVSVNRIELVGVDGIRNDLTDLFVEFNIFEDIFSNTMTGDITLADTWNLLMLVPIVGQEKLIIDFNTPLIDTPMQTEFAVYKISERILKNDKTQIYTLYFTSIETIRNSLKTISKSFKGAVHEIVEDIVTADFGLESKKDFVFEAASEPIKAVIPHWHPLKTINWLSARTVSSEGPDCNFLFYENRDGFFFKSVGKLLNPPDVYGPSEFIDTYFFGPANIRVQEEGKYMYRNVLIDFFRINDYKVQESMDTLMGIYDGLFASHLTTFDLTTRKLENTDFNYREKYPTFRHLPESAKFIPDNKNPFGLDYTEFPNANRRVYDLNYKMFSDMSNQVTPKNWLLQRQSLVAQLKQISLRVEVAGDSRRRVGDIVEVRLPSPEFIKTGNEDQTEKYLTGKYLVASLRHVVRQSEHIMVMELIKDGFNTQIPTSPVIE